MLKFLTALPQPVNVPKAVLSFRRRPRVLFLGHAGHGKDFVTKAFCNTVEAPYVSTSMRLADLVPDVKDYDNWCRLKETAEGRAYLHRAVRAFNTPRHKAAQLTLAVDGYYIGMRDTEEFEACVQADLFDVIVIVDRPGFADEPETSNPLGKHYRELETGWFKGCRLTARVHVMRNFDNPNRWHAEFAQMLAVVYGI